MNLKEKISKDFVLAWKSKDNRRKNFLGIIKSEITTIEKNQIIENLPDEEVMVILNRWTKNLKSNINISNSDQEKYELEVIQEYMPKEMSKEEIENVVDTLISEGANNIGVIMKHFAMLQADKRFVSEIAREKLKSL